MEIYSIQHVAEATGMRTHQLKYFLESHKRLIQDRRLQCGRHRYRYFTDKDISKLVKFIEGVRNND
jgi:DNA-binding transcriptional MerR regulator